MRGRGRAEPAGRIQPPGVVCLAAGPRSPCAHPSGGLLAVTKLVFLESPFTARRHADRTVGGAKEHS